MNNDLQILAMLVQTAGRGRDTVLAHITPKEALLLKLMGGRGSVNPQTGLMEFEDGDGGGGDGGDGGDSGDGGDGGDGEGGAAESEAATAADVADAAFGADLTAAGGGLGALDGQDGVDYGVAFGPEEQSIFGKVLDFLGLGTIEDIIQTTISIAVGAALGPAIGAISRSAFGASVAGRVVGAAITGALGRAAGNLAVQAAEEYGLIDESPGTIAARELGVGGSAFRGGVGGAISSALGGAFGPDLIGSIGRAGLGRLGTETVIGVSPESIGGRGLSLGDALSRGIPAGITGGISAGLTGALGGGFLASQLASAAAREITRNFGGADSRGVQGSAEDARTNGQTQFGGQSGAQTVMGDNDSRGAGARFSGAGSGFGGAGVQLSPATLSALSIRSDVGSPGAPIFGSGNDESERGSPWNRRSLRVKDNLGVTDE